MVSDELITIIQDKFKEGKGRNEIKDALWQDGYSEEDIAAAIAKIQHDAMKQLPGIAWIYRIIDDIEARVNLATPHMTVIIMVACIGLVLLMAAGLYIIFDPLGTQSTARDTQRQADITQLQNALSAYYQENQHYPTSLNQLVPGFLTIIPKDPQKGTTYAYHTIERAGNYTMCVFYESQPTQCVSAKPATGDIPVVPTATPLPSFVPQSATGSGH